MHKQDPCIYLPDQEQDPLIRCGNLRAHYIEGASKHDNIDRGYKHFYSKWQASRRQLAAILVLQTISFQYIQYICSAIRSLTHIVLGYTRLYAVTLVTYE